MEQTTKVTISALVLGGLILSDFIACGAGFFLRTVFDWYTARQKAHGKNEIFSNRYYLKCNWDRIFVSFIFSALLLFLIPALVVNLSETITGKAYNWNSGFSGLIGFAGFDIIAVGYRRMRNLRKKYSAEDLEPDAPAEQEGGPQL